LTQVSGAGAPGAHDEPAAQAIRSPADAYATSQELTMRLPSTSLRDLATREVETVGVDTTLTECARKMRHTHVGCVIVAEPAGAELRPLGIVTDRDIVIEAVAPELDPSTLTAGDVMSQPLATVKASDDLLDALAHMREQGVRRLPVLDDDGMLFGLVSVQDILAALAQQTEAVVGVLMAEKSKEAALRP
jgi:CBS domain-containing protein